MLVCCNLLVLESSLLINHEVLLVTVSHKDAVSRFVLVSVVRCAGSRAVVAATHPFTL